MTTIQELYNMRVRPMMPAARLQLARLILDDLAQSENSVDVSDEWGDEDLAEVSAFSARNGDHLSEKAPGNTSGTP
jgi:hypothetical protein